jgi:hypothetical protein
MFKWAMRTHFRHLSFTSFPMIWRTLWGDSFDPCNHTLKIWESFWDSNSQHGSSLGSVRVHALTLFALPGVCDVTLGSLSWPAPLQLLALGANPRLRLWHLCSNLVTLVWLVVPVWNPIALSLSSGLGLSQVAEAWIYNRLSPFP